MYNKDNNNELERIAAIVLREKAHDYPVYEWMNMHGIGESEYGRILDQMGRAEKVFHHRLYGHHPIYDFPFDDPSKIKDFIEHVLISDSCTKQGLPIVPGDILKNSNIINYCSQKTLEWNFVNAFDLLSGTLSIYSGYKISKKYFNEIDSIESFYDLAKNLGIGTLEFALAIARTNPFLLIGSLLHIIGTLKGVSNDSSRIYFKKIYSNHYLIVADPRVDIDNYVKRYYMKNINLEKILKEKARSHYLK